MGTFTERKTGKGAEKKPPPTVDTEKFASLIKWMDQGEAPVFIGFGR